ncbi:unnamed protein product [Schistosoma mattheei]|uniref:Uncharacterized protein n=1 Tax=Schistosoma mattheei TaxID=31246 RepID=A0A183PYT9_9TREM|nr:unnamed protein product [Schistosoma mattheei]
MEEQAVTAEKAATEGTPLDPPDIEAALTNLPTDVTLPTIEEIRMAIRQIKNWKAAGPHNVPAEALNQEDLEGRANADGLKRRIPQHDTKEKTSEQICELHKH